MAKLKIEVLAARNRAQKLPLGERLIAFLPRYAPYAALVAPLMNLRNWLPGAARLGQRLTGIAAARKLPQWRGKLFRLNETVGPAGGLEVGLFADTFNTYFEPENLWDAVEVLITLGYRVTPLSFAGERRPICCGRTFLSAGLVDAARLEARRYLAAAAPLLARGVPIVGLEPSCLLTARDEFLAMGFGDEAKRLSEQTFLLEEFLANEIDAGRIKGPIARTEGRVLLHGHCHQKAFGVMGAVEKTLGLIDGLIVETIETSCCGMAGAFGYGAETFATSMAMGELNLLPAIRKADADTILAADGFSCRHQIADGTGRAAGHVAGILAKALRSTANLAPMPQTATSGVD